MGGARYAAAEDAERAAGQDDTLERLVGHVPAQPPSFVGREQAMAELGRAMADALHSRGSLALISGEPGIGKTRLMGELALLAARAGVTALWASCWEGGEAPVFWPWTQVLRAYARGRDATKLRSALGPGALELERLVPELAAPGVEAQPAAAEEARFRLFDAAASFLRRASQEGALLVALDNLHAADEASLSLLRFLAADLRDCRVLIVASYREDEVASDTPLWRLLGELGTAALRVPLRGLTADEVEQLMREFGGGAPDPELARALHARTRGNPFFVREVLRLLGAGPAALDGVPDSVRQVIERRLSRLSPGALELVRCASLLGAEFSPALLAELSHQPLEALYAELAPALASRLLERDERRDLYRFAHGLVREVCYAQLDDARRRELHRAVARAIEQRDRDRARPRAAEAAFHYLRAGAPEDLRRALDGSEQAARAARRLGAHEDAALHLSRALELLSRLDEPQRGDDGRRCELLLELGAVHAARGALREAQDTHAHAAELAQLIGSAELTARAALGFGLEFGAGASDEREIALLQSALALQAPGDSAQRARLMSRLSRALLFGVRHAERAQLAEAALAMARRVGEPAALAAVLFERHHSMETGAPEQQLAITDEIVQLAEAAGDLRLALQARALRLGDLLELGQLERYRAECAHYARVVREQGWVGSAWQVPMQSATLAMLEGNFERAEELGAEGLALGRRIQHPGIEVFHHSVLTTIRYLQGRHAERLPALQQGAAAYPSLPVFRAGLALAHSERGERLQASLQFERLASADFADVPRDFLWVFNLAVLSISAHFLGDTLRAAQLYEWLSPYAAYNVRVTRIGISSIGSTQFYLGLLAITLRRFDLAVEHLKQASAAHTRQGALAMLANSQLQLARALAARDVPGDAHAAAEARTQAQELASSLSIRLVLAELEAQPAAASAPALRTRSVRLWRDGQDWALEHTGRTLRLRHAVGVGMLAQLLSEPGRELSALELRGALGPASDAGEILDGRAKQEYRERVAELREELSRCERDNDLGGAERASEELEQIEQALRGAIGLGGRDRKAGSSTERARSSVTKAIKAAIRRIAELDAELGAHLERSVRTGHVCAYLPDPAADLHWEVEQGTT